MSVSDHLLYALLWASFGLGHSLLAASPGRRLLERWFGARDRLAYNAISVLHLILVLVPAWLWLRPGAMAFDWPWPIRAAQLTMIAGGTVILVIGLRGYDLSRFAGTEQWRRGRSENQNGIEPLNTGGLNAHVRHPLYAGGLMLLWGSVTDAFSLSTAFWASAYLAVGIVLEERKLITLYGDAYRQYRARVPALIPIGWLRRSGLARE
ncbi:MAG: methyltransferase family protein [Geminicoccaceae bacterium]